MKFSRQQILIIGGAIFLAVVLFFVIGSGLRSKTEAPEVALTFWGIDDKSVIDKVIESYKRVRPTVRVEYQRIKEEEYKGAVLDALAAGAGPDILMIRNHWLPKEKNKLAEVLPTQFNIAQLRDNFPKVVEEDFTSGGRIYALPLYIDTMALLYNRRILDELGIVKPPADWEEFRNLVPQVTLYDLEGGIDRAAAAIGGSERNIDKASDLLQLLMLQNGTRMVTDNFSGASFADVTHGAPGLKAFNFYLQFSDSSSSYYTWNSEQPNSLEAFAREKVAMIFNYHSSVSKIKAKSPFLDFRVAPMIQVKSAKGVPVVNYADYWGVAVSKQSRAPAWAWDFIVFFTTQSDIARIYMDGTGRPPALRSLIKEKLNDPDLGIFAKQALTAESWYQIDEDKVRRIFNEAIEGVLTGRFDSKKALAQAEKRITELMSSF